LYVFVLLFRSVLADFDLSVLFCLAFGSRESGGGHPESRDPGGTGHSNMDV
jgi:hypothetical protein